MNTLGKQDVINGLKKCKRLAKQDLLAKLATTSQPEFWNKQAEVRRQIYGELIEIVEKGVEAATSYALKAFVKLSPDNDSPEVRTKASLENVFYNFRYG